ncbi:MAG: hypothetical protein V9G18_14785 [Albidovulum sp.]
MAELADLVNAPVADARPFGEAWQRRFQRHAPARLVLRLGQQYRHAAPAKRQRRLEPRRSGADDQHRVGPPRHRGRHLRVPAAAPFLAHRRVLGAADRRAEPVMRIADVAADAFADVVKPAVADLCRQERVGDRRARGADEVEDAAADLAQHRLGAGEAADADHGLAGHRLHMGHVVFERRLLHEARRAHLVAVVRNRDVEEIDEGGDLREKRRPLFPALAGLVIDLDPCGKCCAVAEHLAGFLDEIEVEPRPPRGVAAVAVSPPVGRGVEELGHEVGMRGIDIDDVESGREGPPRRRPVPVAQGADVVQVHPLALPGIAFGHQAVGPEGRLARQRVRRSLAAVPKFDPGKGAVGMDRRGHRCVVSHVAVVPERGIGRVGVVRAGMDRAVFGIHHAPAALGLDPSHGGERVGVEVAHAGAVRHLVEAVGRGDRADPDRLEEDVEAGVAGHPAGRLKRLHGLRGSNAAG